jgi:hypothetical protein
MLGLKEIVILFVSSLVLWLSDIFLTNHVGEAPRTPSPLASIACDAIDIFPEALIVGTTGDCIDALFTTVKVKAVSSLAEISWFGVRVKVPLP